MVDCGADFFVANSNLHTLHFNCLNISPNIEFVEECKSVKGLMCPIPGLQNLRHLMFSDLTLEGHIADKFKKLVELEPSKTLSFQDITVNKLGPTVPWSNVDQVNFSGCLSKSFGAFAARALAQARHWEFNRVSLGMEFLDGLTTSDNSSTKEITFKYCSFAATPSLFLSVMPNLKKITFIENYAHSARAIRKLNPGSSDLLFRLPSDIFSELYENIREISVKKNTLQSQV